MDSLSYQQCYEILSLANDAKWDDASLNYRRLVQQWHPDRYSGHDHERAQQRFVEITSAHHKLRDYYQKNKTLPFASVKADIPNEPIRSTRHTRPGRERDREATNVTTGEALRRITPFMWLMSGAFVCAVVAVLVVLSQLEKRDRELHRETARLQRVLEQEREDAANRDSVRGSVPNAENAPDTAQE